MASGVLTYISELVSGLHNESKIYVLYGKRKQTPNNVEDIFPNNVNLIEIKNFQRSVNPKMDLKAYLEIKDLLLKINPDIVHLNSSKAGALGRILKFFHFKNTKCFYTPHGYSFLMQDISKLKRNIYYFIEMMLGKLGTKTIACGQSEYQSANKLSRNSTYINNGVNIDYLNRFWNSLSNTKNVCFTIGRINQQKNPRLFNKVAHNFPNMKFVWVGDGPLKNELTSHNIKITGWLSFNHLLQLIQPYKYFILCSKWEGLPLSLLEAMYYEKYCFATDVVGNNDVINNEKNGILFTNLYNLKHKIKSNYIDNEIPLYSHNTILNNYSMDKFISEYKKIYDLY